MDSLPNPFLPLGVRMIVYSYLLFTELSKVTCRLSVKERQLLPNTELLDQQRPLVINFQKLTKMNYNQMKYLIKLCTSVELKMRRINELQKICMNCILGKALKKNKSVKITIEMHPYDQMEQVYGVNLFGYPDEPNPKHLHNFFNGET